MRTLLLMLATQIPCPLAWAAPPPTDVRSSMAPIAPPSIEQTVALLRQQVQSLRAQLAELQAIVQVTPAGYAGQAPTVTITGGTINIRAQDSVAMTAQSAMTVRAAVLALEGTGTVSVKAGATLDASGTLIRLNGGGKPLATVGSQVQMSPNSSNGMGQVTTGNYTILAN
jgi:hypothetical protein